MDTPLSNLDDNFIHIFIYGYSVRVYSAYSSLNIICANK